MKKTLVDLTSEGHKCGSVVTGCPAVFKSERNTYVIIGEVLNYRDHDVLRGRVGPGEVAIEVSTDLVDEAIATQRGVRNSIWMGSRESEA